MFKYIVALQVIMLLLLLASAKTDGQILRTKTDVENLNVSFENSKKRNQVIVRISFSNFSSDHDFLLMPVLQCKWEAENILRIQFGEDSDLLERYRHKFKKIRRYKTVHQSSLIEGQISGSTEVHYHIRFLQVPIIGKPLYKACSIFGSLIILENNI